MLLIPLVPQPQQTVSCTLDDQQCTINLRTMTNGEGISVTSLYCDLYVSGSLIIGGVVCENGNRIVRDAYLGFSGDLAFWDMTGAGNDPTAAGLGTTYQLVYLTPEDLALLGLAG